MAIDYKEQWGSLRLRLGDKTIITTAAGLTVNLKEVMDSQIQSTICRREKLMEEFVREKIRTDIVGGTKNSHWVNVILRKSLLGQVSICKEEFKKWLESKKGGN